MCHLDIGCTCMTSFKGARLGYVWTCNCCFEIVRSQNLLGPVIEGGSVRLKSSNSGCNWCKTIVVRSREICDRFRPCAFLDDGSNLGCVFQLGRSNICAICAKMDKLGLVH